MVNLDKIKSLIEQGDLEGLAALLVKTFPSGLVGERDALVTLLMKAGLSHAEAVRWAGRLEEEGYAHHLPGASSRWVFTGKPVSFQELAELIKSEWAGFVGVSEDAPSEAIEFIGQQLGLDRQTAAEVYRGLEAAGYASVAFQDAPDINRGRVLFEFPEVFLKQV